MVNDKTNTVMNICISFSMKINYFFLCLLYLMKTKGTRWNVLHTVTMKRYLSLPLWKPTLAEFERERKKKPPSVYTYRSVKKLRIHRTYY